MAASEQPTSSSSPGITPGITPGAIPGVVPGNTPGTIRGRTAFIGGVWQNKPATWLALVVCLALAVPMLLLELHRADVRDDDEAGALATSLQTWHSLPQRSGIFMFSPHRLTPVYNGQPQLSQPPGLTWAHLLAYTLHQWLTPPEPPPKPTALRRGLPSRTESPQELNSKSEIKNSKFSPEFTPELTPELTPAQALICGRLVSFTFALLAIMGAFWAGRCVGDNRTAIYAALFSLTMPVLVFCGHLANAATMHAGLATVAVAAALWAIRPLKTPPSLLRQALGWMLCGLALAGALLVVGPVAIFTVILPILLLLILCPGRLSHLLGQLAAMLIAFALVLPWIVYVHEHNPATWRIWLTDLFQVPDVAADGNPWRMLGWRVQAIGAAWLPWTLWLVGALVQPFSPSSQGMRIRMFLGWVWLVTLLAMFLTLPRMDLLPLIPAAAVLLAQLFTQYVDLAAQGRYAKFWRRLCWPHTILLLGVTVALPVVLHQPALGGLENFVGALNWWTALGMGLVLLGILVLALRWMLRDYPALTLLAWCAWTLVAMLLVTFPLARGPLAQNSARADGAGITSLTAGAPVFWLAPPEAPDAPDAAALPPEPAPEPAPEQPPEQPPGQPPVDLVFYTGQAMPALTSAQLRQALTQQESLYLIAAPQAAERLRLNAIPLLALPRLHRVLYTCAAALPPESMPPKSMPPKSVPTQTMPATSPAPLPTTQPNR